MFKPRVKRDGIDGSKYYYTENPFEKAGYGLPNCTCYAWGRTYEIMGKYPAGLPMGNAEDWWNTVDTTKFHKGSEPQVGAIICLKDGPYSGCGHVAVVEKIENSLGKEPVVTFSNSAYGGAYFYRTKGTKSNNYGFHRAYTFQGFIYNPAMEKGKWDKQQITRWRYRKADGSLFRNKWAHIDGEWYFFDEDGYAVVGWQTINNNVYYFHLNGGNMVYGWQKIEGQSYYFHRSGGNMMTGWQTIDGKSYFLYPDGHLAKNEITPDGFKVDSNGVCL